MKDGDDDDDDEDDDDDDDDEKLVKDGKKEFVKRFCPAGCHSPPPPFILLSNRGWRC